MDQQAEEIIDGIREVSDSIVQVAAYLERNMRALMLADKAPNAGGWRHLDQKVQVIESQAQQLRDLIEQGKECRIND